MSSFSEDQLLEIQKWLSNNPPSVEIGDQDLTVPFVREIINTSLTDGQVESAIASAVVLTENRLQRFNLGKTLMIEIQRWVAAHFCSLIDPSTRVETEKLGEASVGYSSVDASSKNNGIMTTRWGRTAAALDPSGVLCTLSGLSPKLYAL